MSLADRAQEHGRLHLKHMGKRKQECKAAHRKRHRHHRESLTCKSKSRARNHARHTRGHTHVACDAHKGGTCTRASQEHGQLPRRHHDEFIESHGSKRPVRISIYCHHGKPQNRNHRQESRRPKHHARVTCRRQEFTNAMVAERETEQVNGRKNSCQVENCRHKPEAQKSLVVTAVIADRFEFHMNGVVHLLGELVCANGRNHRADFLDRKGVGQIILPARIHRNHGSLEPERTAFHVVRQHDEALQVATDNSMFAFTALFANHFHRKHRVCAERHFNLVG